MKQKAINIIRELQSRGHEAVLCGGCVRDQLLRKEPHDFDIATSAKPEEVESIFSNTKAVGKSFGVILVKVGSIDFEVATFRKDGIYEDGRRPESIEYSSMEEDAMRRDFTINALFFDPVNNSVYDFVDGLRDIRCKTLRFVDDPTERISEDSLRILRFIRFLVKLDFKPDELSMLAIKKLAHKVNTVAKDRVKDELIKILEANNPKRAIELLQETGILKYIMPEIDAMEGVEQNPEWHEEGCCMTHTKLALDSAKNASPIVKLAVLFHDSGKPETFEIIDGKITNRAHHKASADIAVRVLTDLRFSNEDIETVRWLVYNHMKEVEKMRVSKLKRLLSHPNIKDLIELMRADAKGCFRSTSKADFLENKLSTWTPAEIKPEPIINGLDLIKMGFKPGPLFKIILEGVSTMQLENEIKTKEEAIGYIEKIYSLNI